MAAVPLDYLEQYRITKVPPTLYYIPNFVSEVEADHLLSKVYAAPRPKWTRLSNRRLQNWGGVPHPKGMIPEKLPSWLDSCCKKVQDLHVFDSCLPNHVLVNEYTPGQGIMPHEDGPLYHPVVTTISLGSHTLLDFYHPLTDKSGDASLHSRHFTSVLLEPASLLVVTEDMYTKYLHGIKEVKEDLISELVCNLSNCQETHQIGNTIPRLTRVSLTIRHVPKIIKLKLL